MQIDFAKQLNSEQLEVVLHGDGPVLVLAGAGSGKTRTITYRVVYLLENGVLPQEILLLTFTNKAAREMLNRVGSLLQSPTSDIRPPTTDYRLPFSGTFHSVANRILRQYANEIGYTPDFTILDQEDSHSLIKVCLKEMQIDTTERRFPSPSAISSVLSYSRNACVPIKRAIEERYSNFFSLSPIFERLVEVYAQHKHEANAMDFDDLLLNLQRLLIERPLILEKLSKQFRYILVDEYQDTNRVQSKLVQLFSSVHRNLLVVGDDAQSIYSFRAAQVRNILDFPDLYPDTKIFRLTTNYRSTPEILDVANCSIGNNIDQFKKDLQAVCQPSEKPKLAALPTASKEAEFVATQIINKIQQGASMREIAVLFRAAFHSQSLEFELMKRGIPYEYRGGLKFFERAHVKDVISYLRLKANPKDESAWLRVLSHQPGIGLVTAQKIISQIKTIEKLSQTSAFDVQISKRASQSWGNLTKLLQKIASETHPTDLIRLVIGGDYNSYLEAEYPDFKDRLDDLEQFAIFAESASDLSQFLSDVSLTDEYGVTRNESYNSNQDRIVLSTIHQAKGLEWDNVFVIHVVDGKFPSPRSVEEGGLEEERRLFYVATTRARKYLCYAYPLFGGSESVFIQQPSLFLQELPNNLLTQVRIKPSTSMINSRDNNEDTVIVFDELGERSVDLNSNRKSFLRDVDEL